MSARESDLPNLPPPECAAALDALQRRLDGEVVALPPAVAIHVAGCPDCRGRLAAIDRLTGALDRADSFVPALLTERIVAGAIADMRRRRRVRRWALSGVGIAAGVVAAFWLIRPLAPGPEMARRPSPPPDLRQDITDAGDAVAALTRRAAADAVDAGRRLVPNVPSPPWPSVMEPARPFEEAGAALADGFEPVATSARRAALLFWRELPTADSKPD